MPYKNREDRTEAVRRHREKKKQMEEGKRAFNEVMDELGPFLGSMGFKCMGFNEFIKICQNDLTIREDGVYAEGIGRILDAEYEPRVFYAGDTVIILPTLGKRSDLKSFLHGIYLQTSLIGHGDRSPLWSKPYIVMDDGEGLQG